MGSTRPRFRAGHFEWNQSSIGLLLRCPRRFYLANVLQLPVDHTASNYAHFLGSAGHGGIEFVLHQANLGVTPERGPVLDAVMVAFEEALHRAQESGEHTDPDGLDRALERLEGERMDWIMRLANDPRIRAIEWRGIEWPFAYTNRGTDEQGKAWRRRYKGTLDAWGVARSYVRDFGVCGREPVDLEPGDGVLCDWKFGTKETTPTGSLELALSVQLGFYAIALNREVKASWRTFIGLVQDLGRPKAPTDGEGKRIPKWLPDELNPEWVEAMTERGVPASDLKTSRKKAKDADGNPIPKNLPKRPNPEFAAAQERNKGALFHEGRVSYPVVVETVTAAIRQAEAGLFPASGALTGQCMRCPYQPVCTRSTPEDEI